MKYKKLIAWIIVLLFLLIIGILYPLLLLFIMGAILIIWAIITILFEP